MVTVRAGSVVSSRDEDRGEEVGGGDAGAPSPAAGADESAVKEARRARALAVKQKLANVSKALAAEWEPPPPTAILSSGLDEAKAYVPATRPREASTPAVLVESRRVELVDPRDIETVTLDQRTLEAARRRADEMEREAAATREAEAAREAAVEREAAAEVRWKRLVVAVMGVGLGLLAGVVALILVARFSATQRAAAPAASVSAAPAVSAAPVALSTQAPVVASSRPEVNEPTSEPTSEAINEPTSELPAPEVSPSARVVSAPLRSSTSSVTGAARPRTSVTPKGSSSSAPSAARPPELVN